MSIGGNGFLRFESLASAFKATAAVREDATLLRYENKGWSYRQIDAWSDLIADRIEDELGRQPRVVGVMSNELPLVLASYLGILKAGHACAGLDPGLPQDRLATHRGAASICCCLAGPSELEQATAVMGSRRNVLAVDPNVIAGQTSGRQRPIGKTSLSHVLFTSGSTGTPKVVPRTHGAILHNLDRHRALNLNAADKVTLLSRRGFFDSISNPYAAILSGSTVCALRLLDGGAPDLIRWISEERPTVYYSFPTIFRHLVASKPRPETLCSLRLVYLGGENVSSDDLRHARKLLPATAEIAVGLGSTETGLTALNIVAANDPCPDVVSVGKPLPGIRIEIWDENGRVLEPMREGTIVFRSPFIFQGYLNQNSSSISPDPDRPGSYMYVSGDCGYFDHVGGLVVTGRADEQIKIRGYRIELGEIETILRRFAGLHDAVALSVSLSDDSLDKSLVAFVTSNTGQVDETAIRLFLADRLPHHMVPRRIFIIPRIPQTANGKADRRILVEIYEGIRRAETAGRAIEVPTGVVEQKVASLWCDILKTHFVSRSDRFFDLGGNSITALIFISRLGRELGHAIPLNFLFDDDELTSFCSRCAAHLAERQGAPSSC
ncbi:MULTISPECIES: non-ribosomal peptide synthetase [unclassified Bradyrhizobium]|uniref:non-ribosomal peptide synthetase n=1 Tax=unclassified Bradyrhizobium TaxID=2631580 RepID=UPI0028E4D920|nr:MULTISPECIES: non-ribosomal peptide synthetase [unclassified Bradyrhizobium]